MLPQLGPLRFITGSDHKFAEASLIVPGMERLKVDLPEIQSLDPQAVVAAKLALASKSYAGTLIVEDTSLFLDCLGGTLPGPFIKWFLESRRAQGIYELAERYGVYGARGMCIVGVMTWRKTRFFTGEVHGTIVPFTMGSEFGWDPIFRPNGSVVTFGQMMPEEKNRDSHRSRAFQQVKVFLDEERRA